MAHQKRLRPYLEYLQAAGLEVDDVTTSGSSHYKIVVTRKGNRRFFIAPYSSSDRRSFENWKSNVRKWLKEIAHDQQEDSLDTQQELHHGNGRTPSSKPCQRNDGTMGA